MEMKPTVFVVNLWNGLHEHIVTRPWAAKEAKSALGGPVLLANYLNLIGAEGGIGRSEIWCK